MKKYLFLLFLIATQNSLVAQFYESVKVEVSGGGGGLIRGNERKAAGYGFVTADFTYYYSDSYGLSAGITRIGSFDEVDGVWEVPFYLTRRSGVAKRKDKAGVGGQSYSTGDAAWGVLNYLLPTRLDWGVGTTFGYYQGERYANAQQDSEGYMVRHRFGFSVDAEARFYYVFGRVKLSISPMVGYLFTRNISYVGDGSANFFEGKAYRGMTPHIRLRIKGGLAFSF